MATEEIKPETKKTEQKQSPHTPPPLPLPYKTCNLKVSIHCEGCKRKVKKILTSIEGVCRVDIDVKQNNVTVMGIASPETLLKKLHKAGKNADLWPEIPDSIENKLVDPKKKKKKEENPEITDNATSSGTDKPESVKHDVAGGCRSGDNGETYGPVKELKKEILKEKDSVPADSSSPVDSLALAESPVPMVKKEAEESSGNIGKKKKKKGQNMSSLSNRTGGPGRTRSLPPPTSTTPTAEDHDCPFNHYDGHQIMTNNIPPHQIMYPYPPHYYSPQIIYGVSYNVAQPPVNVDVASYYYSPVPPHSYVYTHPGNLPSNHNPYPSRTSDSLELFNDENPNGCSVM